MSGHAGEERPSLFEREAKVESTMDRLAAELAVAVRDEDWELAMKWALVIHGLAKRMVLGRMGCILPVE